MKRVRPSAAGGRVGVIEAEWHPAAMAAHGKPSSRLDAPRVAVNRSNLQARRCHGRQCTMSLARRAAAEDAALAAGGGLGRRMLCSEWSLNSPRTLKGLAGPCPSDPCKRRGFLWICLIHPTLRGVADRAGKADVRLGLSNQPVKLSELNGCVIVW